MAEVLIQFDNVVASDDGRTYTARVCGRPVESGMWEGWIEFEPVAGGPAIRTSRESKQPNRADLEYWASGLTATYLEGALERAQDPALPDLRPATVAASSAFDGPADHRPPVDRYAQSTAPKGGAVLDPFHVYEQGEDVLLEELSALSEGHLRNIVRQYGLADEESLDLHVMHRAALAEFIVAGVRKRAG